MPLQAYYELALLDSDNTTAVQGFQSLAERAHIPPSQHIEVLCLYLDTRPRAITEEVWERMAGDQSLFMGHAPDLHESTP